MKKIKLGTLPLFKAAFLLLFVACAPLKNIVFTYEDTQFSDVDIAKLKNTTTVFFLLDSDRDRFEEFSEAIKKVWKFTPCIVTLEDSISKYKAAKYSHFNIEADATTTFRGNSSAYYLNISYELKVPSIEKRRNVNNDDDDGSVVFSYYELFFTGPFKNELARKAFPNNSFRKEAQRREKRFNEMIRETKDAYKNWTPGHFALFLQETQLQLAEKHRIYSSSPIKKLDAMKRLEKGTVLIPAYTFDKLSRLTWSEKKKFDRAKLLKDFKYNYKIIKGTEINDYIQAEEEVFVFDLVRGDDSKLIRIYSSKEGLIYQHLKAYEIDLKPADFARI